MLKILKCYNLSMFEFSQLPHNKFTSSLEVYYHTQFLKNSNPTHFFKKISKLCNPIFHQELGGSAYYRYVFLIPTQKAIVRNLDQNLHRICQYLYFCCFFFILFLSFRPIFAKLSCKKLFKKSQEILPLIKYNALDYCLEMFFLEQIYLRLDMKSNMFEFNLVHGELSITVALI